MSGSPVIRARSLNKVYGAQGAEVHALRDVSVDITGSTLTAIMGPSGSGKSTLMHLLAGLDRPTSGTVLYDDLELSSLSDRQLTSLRRNLIGFVFQAFNLVPTLTVLENVLLPFELGGTKPSGEHREWILERAAELGLMPLLERRPHQLSGGQQQRVAIARALAIRPRVIFADEPTGNLDSRTGVEVLAMLESATREQDQAVVLVTHDPAAAAWADRVLFISDGRIVHDVGRTDASTLSEMVLELGGAR
ncbi:ABC transporter ATP-binding protein [Amnibacterium kyonggiense]|uniref:Putative ABC transport system ATP-binding protein n=1 Tax=Amnibacterium kyonggiense TaxID=595671 RepID=A0A4R7FPP5_9MICO|nr:ABC transporter ATP-binding protein [Amnibacterium kyonggiense]TDS79725.1 putative ABC transport system ATP-binding protein [Amnibacterium kyonggiense]